MSKLSAAILSGALLTVQFGAAQAAQALHDRASFLTFENDTFFYSDRYYTNGIQLSAKTSRDGRGELARRLTRALCRNLHCDDARLLTSQFHAGQLMYTPRDITIATPQQHDRPWAGLLYYEQEHTLVAPDQRTLTIIGAQIGVTGKAAMTEPAQMAVHRMMKRPLPAGWQHQIGASLAVMASVEQRRAFDALSFDLTRTVRLNTASYWRVSAGTIQTHAAAGLAIVIGKDLPLVSPAPPGITTKLAGGATRGIDLVRTCMARWVRCTAFASVEARAVAYNVFLDGRAFSGGPRVRKRHVVFDAVSGVRFDFPGTRSASHGPWFAQFKVTRRSPEFRSRLRVHSQTVGALTIGTEF